MRQLRSRRTLTTPVIGTIYRIRHQGLEFLLSSFQDRPLHFGQTNFPMKNLGEYALNGLQSQNLAKDEKRALHIF